MVPGGGPAGTEGVEGGLVVEPSRVGGAPTGALVRGSVPVPVGFDPAGGASGVRAGSCWAMHPAQANAAAVMAM
jgi:hypothetical protein